MTVQIAITVTDAEYRKLAAIADRKHTQVHTLVEAQIRRAINPPPRRTALAELKASLNADGPDAVRPPTPGEASRAAREQRRASVREAHGRGLNDKQIADETGYPYGTVYLDRCLLGLPAQVVAGRPRKQATT